MSTATTTTDRLADVGRRIEDHAHSDVPELEFFPRWLDLLLELADLRGGAVWTLNANGVLAVHCERNAAADPHDQQGNHARVQRLLDAVREAEPTIQDDTVLVPLRRADQIVGVAEMLLEPTTPDARRLELLGIVDEAAGHAKQHLDWRNAEAGSEAELAFWDRAQRTFLALHAATTPRDVAHVAANDGRVLLGCDRVAVAVRRGTGVEVLAITGVGRVNQRSNQVRTLERVATLVTTTGHPIAYSGRMPDLPGEVQEQLLAYLDESGVGALEVLPLVEPHQEEAEGERSSRPPRPIGAIVVERTDGRFSPPASRRVARFADQVAVALGKAVESDRILLHGLRRTLGGWFASLRGRRLLGASLLLAALAGAIAALVFVPWEYRVEGTGQLLPVVQCDVFAPAQGRVVETFVVTGERVEAGDPLLRLQDDELDMEWLTLKTELDTARQSERALQAELDDANLRRTRDETIQLRGRLERTRVEARGLRERLQLVEAELESLLVLAPVEGTVTTPDLPRSLTKRPVQRGDALVEIMDDRDRWQLEIEVPERRLGHVLAACARSEDGTAPVEFVLSTHPQERYEGRLTTLATRTGASTEHGASARAIVEIDASTVPERRIGSEVVARITCDDQPLGYVLFGDFLDYVRGWWW